MYIESCVDSNQVHNKRIFMQKNTCRKKKKIKDRMMVG